MHPNIHSNTIYNSQDMDQMSWVRDNSLKCPLTEEEMVYIHNEILLSHKKEWNNVIWSNTSGPRDDHIKWSKSDKDKYNMISLTGRV